MLQLLRRAIHETNHRGGWDGTTIRGDQLRVARGISRTPRVVAMVTAGLWLLCVGLGKITEAPPQPRTENKFPH